MKRLFTPLLLFLTVLLGGINAVAEDEVIELTADMFYTWTGYDQNAVKGSVASGQDFNIGNGVELSGGGVVCGNGSVAKEIYADLTGSSKLIIEGTAGMPLRVMMNRQEDDSLTEVNPTIGEDGTVELDLTAFPYVHLNTIKVNWGAPTGVITSIKFVKPGDPLMVPKEQLKNELSKAKLYNSVAYSEDSFNALQDAILDGETALSAANATEDSLGAAVTNIEDAIAGLTFAEGFSNLTADMFKTYSSVDESLVGGGTAAGCAYDLFKTTGMPYGDGSVGYLNWADLSGFDKLYVTVATGKPRFCMNRTAADGQEYNSGMLDMAPGNGNSSTASYLTSDGDVVIIDLNKMVADTGIARLHSIKGYNGDVFVSGMYLYKAKDPLEPVKDALAKEVENARQYDSFAKTVDSFAALLSAIAAAEAELDNKDATAESLEAAGKAIEDAIAGLTLEEGYEHLTKEMYKSYASYEEPGEAEDTNGAYELFKSTNNPYGTGGSDNNRWADVSEYDKLIVTFIGNDKPRVWINRKEYNGTDGNSMEDSNMLDLQEGNGKWSTAKYTSFEKDGNINIFTVDLNAIKADYGFARLHGIKYGWGAEGIVTGMYLYNSTDELELPKEELTKAIAKGEQCDGFLKTEESWNSLLAAIEEGKALLEEAKPTLESIEAATAKITDAIEGLQLKPGYSELTKEMFKLYASVEEPGEGEATNGDFKLFESTGQPFGVSTVDYNKWAELTDYDMLIVKTDGEGGKPRFLMNRLADGGQQGSSMEDSKMLDITFGEDTWSAKAYAACEDDAYSIDLIKVTDDYGFARLNTIKSRGGDVYVTGMYLYKDPADAAGFDLSFSIDDPAHVIIAVDGEEITDLNVGDNEKQVSDRAKLSISPAEGFKLTSVKVDGEEVVLKDGALTKTVVRNISFEITTEDADPLAKPKKALASVIEGAKLYDSFAKTEESFGALTAAIAEAEAALAAEDATETSLDSASESIGKAIEGLALEEGYSYLTAEMFRKYASVEDPGEGEETECAYELFNTSRELYGDKNNADLKWADLSGYDQLVLTVVGTGDLPRFCLNNEVAAKFDINPIDGTNEATEAYQTVDGNRYIIDLRKIVKDHGFAHLHSIQVNGWGTGAFLNGMYLYKNPKESVKLSFDIDDASRVVVTVGENVIEDFSGEIEVEENTSISIAAAEGCLLESVTANDEPVEITDNKYEVTLDGSVLKITYAVTTIDILKQSKEELTALIAKASLYDSFAKTADSFAALLSAIAAAEAELENAEADADSVAAAYKAVEDAIAGLELEEGYEYLSAEMFKTYDSVEEPGEGNAAGCAYKLFEVTDTPYGDGNVSERNWADIAGYDKLIITMSGSNKPRAMMNRMEAGGADGDSKETSKMLEMQPGNGKWSTSTYTAYDSENNVFTVNLRKVVEDYGFARLNAIKYSYGVSGIVTGLYLYTSTDDLEGPKEDLAAALRDAGLYDDFAKTEESWSALQAAIAEGEAKLAQERPTVESVEAATAKIAEAIEGLSLKAGYSYLTADMYRRYASVETPGEGEPASGNYKLYEDTNMPFGVSTVDYLQWADLSAYDRFIVKTDGEGGVPRFLMNRLADGGQQGGSMEDSKMLDMGAGNGKWSTEKYISSEDGAHCVDLNRIIDDYGFARLNTVKTLGDVNCFVTGMYLYKDPEAEREFTLTFDIDDPAHVVIAVDGEEITDLKAGANEKKASDRAVLSIAPAESFKLVSVKADGEDVVLKDGALTKTVVRNISFEITTEDADPLAKPKKALASVIEGAKLYDSFAKTEESFGALTAAIAEAEAALAADDATEASLNSASEGISKAIEGLALEEGYSYLTAEMFRKHASVEDPGEGEETDCAYELFNTSRELYGDKNNADLKWADLSGYDQLILTTVGAGDLPRFCMNNEVSAKFEINPYDGTNEATEAYQTVDGNRYIIDLGKIVEDHGFAHLHSIQVNGWGTGAFLNGMYLYKKPFVAVAGISLDKTEAVLVDGGSLALTATVTPDDATEPVVAWSSSDEDVAIVDAAGNVTAVGVGKATITASCGDYAADCAFKCYPQTGDADWNGRITIADAVDITNYVVRKKTVAEGWDEDEWKEFYEKGANANEEGPVTFADASAAVTLSLAQPAEASAQSRIAAAYDDMADALLIGAASEASGLFSIPVSLDNSMEYVALQADIILPEGMNVEVKAGRRVAGTHILQTRKFAGNHIRVALYNLKNSAFADDQAPLLEIVTDSFVMDPSDIEISNILAADSEANEFVLASRIASPSGVAVIGLDADAPVKVFDLNGIFVSDTMEGLMQGTYIVRQGTEAKKVRIR